MALKIGLIADTHIPESRKTLWPQVYDAFQGVDYIFHGGDVHELDLLDELEKIAPVYCARGNGEDGSGGRPVQPEDPRVKYAWTLEMEGLTIGLTHYIPAPERPPDFTVAKWVERFFPDKKPDIIISGDSHTELIVEMGGILCVNPGSPTYLCGPPKSFIVSVASLLNLPLKSLIGSICRNVASVYGMSVSVFVS